MNTFKVIIAGGRDFKKDLILVDYCEKILANKENIEIVSGGQRTYTGTNQYGHKQYIGADYFGEMYAKWKGFKLTVFPADWDKHGKAAGPIRNRQMAEYANALIAFDTGGPGTANMIKLAKEYGLLIKVKNCRK